MMKSNFATLLALTHKLGCVFFTLGNFHPCYRSWLKSNFLVAVATGPTIKVHVIDNFFRPFVEDAKSLSTDATHVWQLLKKHNNTLRNPTLSCKLQKNTRSNVNCLRVPRPDNILLILESTVNQF